MHRSGTSAFARVFNLLGARLPDNLLAPEDAPGNPMGFWEPARIVQLHNELLSASARAWFDLEPFPAEWFRSDMAQSYASRLATLVQEEYAQAPLFVVKDPRISRLVPLWLDVLKRLEVEPLFVVALRNPLEIAASHNQRDRFRAPLSLLLWLRHMLDAERDTRGHPRAVAAYADLLGDWRPVAARVATELGLQWTRASRKSELAIDDFLRSDARHHVVPDADLEARKDVSPWIRDAYRIFRRLARGESERDLRSLDVIRAELDKSESAWGAVLFDAVHRLRTEREHSRGELSQLRSEAAALAEEITRQDAKLAKTRKHLELSRAETEPAKEKVGRLDALVIELESTVGSLESEREGLVGEVERLVAELARKDATLAASESAQTSLDVRLAKARAEIDVIQAELAESASVVMQLREHETIASAELAERRDFTARAEEELMRLTRELEDQTATLEQRAAELERRQTTIDELWGSNDRLAARLARKEHEVGLKTEELALLTAAQKCAQTELADLRRDSRALRALSAGGRIGTSPRRSTSQLLSWIARGRASLLRDYARAWRSRDVDTIAYLVQYEDVARAGVNPLMHYIEHGRREGRDARPVAGAERFVSSGAAAAGTPRVRSLSQLTGWIVRGHIRLVLTYAHIRRARSFDVPAYLRANPDVAAARVNPLMHYVEHGARELRALHPPPESGDGVVKRRVTPAQARWRAAVSRVAERLRETDAVLLIHTGAEDDVDFGQRQVWRISAGIDAAELVGELEKGRAGGATHVFVTADALRVIDSRPGLGDYLSRHTRQVMRRDADCALFVLAHTPQQPDVEGDLSGIVSALVPRNQPVVVVGSLKLQGSRSVWHIPSVVRPHGALIGSLEDFRSKGAHYLAIGASQLSELEQHDGLKRYLENQYRVVLRREGVGVLYEAVGLGSADTAESPTATS